jgi:hypothetical protein
MKYEFSTSFRLEHTLSGKTEGPLWVLRRNSLFFKPPKNLCITPKCLIEIEYWPHVDEMQISDSFSL